MITHLILNNKELLKKLQYIKLIYFYLIKLKNNLYFKQI